MFLDPKGNRIVYLNRPGELFASAVLTFLRNSKQGKASAQQWLGMIRSAPGIKATELKDLALEERLETLAARGGPIRREDLIRAVDQGSPTVKEITLAQPVWTTWSWGKRVPGAQYSEVLYVLNSERNNMEDRLEVLRFEMDDLNFNLDKLAQDPGIVVRIDNEIKALKAQISTTPDFTAHHFSEVLKDSKLGRNLMAHMRVSRLPEQGLFFIEEIQSDWAQKGRRHGFGANYPEAPFVTKTELWAGLVLRRAMQQAAQEGFRKVAWIRGKDMANGGSFGGDLDEFYQTILPPLADKVLGKAGVKTRMIDIALAERTMATPCVELNDKAVELLKGTLPLYSLADLVDAPRDESAPEVLQVLSDAREMLGSVVSVRAVHRLYDLSTGNRVAGTYVNKLVQVALDARDFAQATWHESFHAAVALMATDDEADLLRQAFWPTSRLNQAVRERLAGHPLAVRQCADPMEAAAHAFALWKEGRFSFERDRSAEEGLVDKLFRVLGEQVDKLTRWVRRVGREGQITEAQDFFERLARGELRERDEVSKFASNHHAQRSASIGQRMR
jgi:hypothetical protein